LCTMADLAEAAAKLAAAEAANRKRAERFGIPFTAPTPFNPLIGVGHTDARRLAAAADRDGQAGGLVSGVNPADPAEKAKAQKRAERFGISAFDYDAERAKAAGLNDEERKYREERRRRAAKFGKPDELDLQVAKAAAVSLQLDPVVDKLADAAAADKPTVRPNALHIRGCGYLPAATRDIYSFFGEFRPSWIEWLNGISLNVIFEDAATATRALETFAERIPAVAGVPPVWEGWRVALKPLRKQKTDKYAAKGTESTVYLRYATAADTKEQAIGSTGPRTHGTYSKRGEYSIVKGRVMDTDSEEDEETGAGSGAGGAADVGGEAEMGSSAGAASASAAPAGEGAARSEEAATGAAGAAASAAPSAGAASQPGGQAGGSIVSKAGRAFVYAGVRDMSAVTVASTVVSALQHGARTLQLKDQALLDGRGRRPRAGAADAAEVGADAAASGSAAAAADGAAAGEGGASRRGRQRAARRGRGGRAVAEHAASAVSTGEAAADGRKDRGGLGEDAADDGAGLTGKRGRRRYEEETDGRPLDRETAAAVFMEEGGGEGGGTGAQGSSDDWLIVGGGAGGGSGSATGDGDARVRGRGLVKARAIAADALGADAGAGVGDAGNGTAAGLPAVHNASEAPASGPHE
jgi:hypothetical protein